MWGRLTEALRDGEPKSEGLGSPSAFKDKYSDPKIIRRFLAHMDSYNGLAGPQVAAHLDWSGLHSFADIGGARGNLAAQLTQAHPHLKGTVFDLPAIEPFFDEHMERMGTASRVKFRAGDFFTDELPSADVLIFGHILHDWPSQARSTLLQRAYQAVPPGGAVAVIDQMISADHNDAHAFLASLNVPAGQGRRLGVHHGGLLRLGDRGGIPDRAGHPHRHDRPGHAAGGEEGLTAPSAAAATDRAAQLPLAGTVGIVTGGTQGLGLAIARKLCQAGCHVVLNYAHRDDRALEGSEELSGLPGGVSLAKADITTPEGVARVLAMTRAERGRLDFFIHNAASLRPMSAAKPDALRLHRDLDAALAPLLHGTQEMTELMSRRPGRIVAVSSTGARRVIPQYVSLGVAKAALENLVRYLAVELAGRGITVNAVATAKLDKGKVPRPAGRGRAGEADPAAGRLTCPQDVADAVYLLCLPEAAWIQGQVITVDGGLGLLS